MPRWPKMSPLTAEQQQLVADNYPLVLYIVRRMWSKYSYVSSLGSNAIDEGYLALVKAARAFDPNKISRKTGNRVKFGTYALRTIHTEVLVAARKWRRDTFVPDLDLLHRQYRGRVGVVNKIEMDHD